MTAHPYPPLPSPDHESECNGYLWPEAYSSDQMRVYAAAAIALQSARHNEELLAAEITIGKLREQNDTAISVVSRLLQVHEDRSIEDATNLAYAMLSAAAAPEPDGWKLVPIEPTADMYIRGGEAFFDLVGHATDDGDTEDDQEHAAAIYRAMLESAPQAQPESKPEHDHNCSTHYHARGKCDCALAQPERKPLVENIRLAQIVAGEDAVIADLRAKGLIP